MKSRLGEPGGGVDVEEKRDILMEFQKKYPTRKEKEAVLQKMSDEEIDSLIKSCSSVQGKIFYSRFKKGARK